MKAPSTPTPAQNLQHPDSDRSNWHVEPLEPHFRFHGMKRRLGACRCSARPTASEALWITDDILAATFQQFARRHVRHQSHVPGPLEAQRRATRRKNTVLAHVPRGPPLDPAIFYPTKSQTGWWNREPSEGTKVPHSGLPAWLLGPGRSAAVEESSQNTNLQDFEGDLACCESLSDLRTLVRDHSPNLRLNLAQADAIYEHVMGQEWPASWIAEYLAEPAMHPHGNHVKFMRKFEADVYDSKLETSNLLEDWATILQGICKSVQLGLLSALDWMQVVDSALAVCYHIDGSETYLSPEGRRSMSSAAVVLALLDSLRQCPVIPREDIRLTWLRRLPMRAMRGGFNLKIVKLLRVIGLKRDASLIVELLVMTLQRPQTTADASSTAAGLKGLVRGTLLKVMGQTTETLAAEVLKQHLEPEILSNWMKVLRAVNREVDGEPKYQVKITGPDVHLLPDSPGPFQDGPQRALLVLWTVHQLNDPTATSKHFEPPDCLSVVRRLLQAEEAQTVHNLHTALLQAMDTVPLPDKETLIARLPALLGRRVGHNDKELEAAFTKFLEGDLAQISHDATYGYMRKNHRTSLAEAVERVNSDLPAFKRLIRLCISTNKILFKVIVRILRNNPAFIRALSNSWAADIEYGRRCTDILRQDAHGRSTVDPTEALDTIHCLAIAFATSTAASSRTAFKKTYWCYKVLRTVRAPIEPPMIRALWHAGFERFDAQVDTNGCGSTQLKWLLSKVQEHEGRGVALQLMRNPAFRKARALAMERLAREETPAEELEREELATFTSPYDQVVPVNIESLEASALKIVREEAEERSARHKAFEVLPEPEPLQEFERWLAGTAEVVAEIDAKEEKYNTLEPIWSWDKEPRADVMARVESRSPTDTVTEAATDLATDAGTKQRETTASSEADPHQPRREVSSTPLNAESAPHQPTSIPKPHRDWHRRAEAKAQLFRRRQASARATEALVAQQQSSDAQAGGWALGPESAFASAAASEYAPTLRAGPGRYGWVRVGGGELALGGSESVLATEETRAMASAENEEVRAVDGKTPQERDGQKAHKAQKALGGWKWL